MSFDKLNQNDNIARLPLEQGSGEIARQAWDGSSKGILSQYGNSDTSSFHLPGLTLHDGEASTLGTGDSNVTNSSSKSANDSGAEGGTSGGAPADSSTAQMLATLQKDFQILSTVEQQLGADLQALVSEVTGNGASTASGESSVGTPNTSTGEAAAGTPNTSTGEASVGTPNTSTGEAAAGTPNTSTGEASVGTPNTSTGEASVGTPSTSTGEAAAGTPNTSTGEASVGTPSTSTGEASVGTPNTSTGEASVGTPSTSSGEAASGALNTGTGEAAAGAPSPSGPGSDSGASTTASTSNPASGNAGIIGFFGGDTDAAEADSISSALGKNVVPAAYLDWTQPAAQTTQYETGQYASWVAANPGEGMILGVPLTYDGQSLASTASGANNAEFTQMAQQLVAAGQGNDVIRLGVEMNGSWATDNNDGNPTDFINAYNNAAAAMKAVPGANFSFDWNPSAGEQNGIPTEAYYPGNANVNSIGVDVYDWNENNPNATPAQTWNLLTTEAGGLNELAAFAQQQGKPFAIPEYAVSAPEGQAGNANATSPGMGDDPSFINNIANFLNTQAQAEGVAFQSYFDSPSGGVGTTLETSPNSYSAYINDFSNGGIDGAEA